MADTFDDDDADFEPEPDEARRDAEYEAALAEQLTRVPPELYDALRPLLVLAAVANYLLMGHADDPVPQALTELLDYDLDTVRTVAEVRDTPGLARLMAENTLALYDFVLIGRLVFESRLAAALRAYLNRGKPPEEEVANPGEYLLAHGEGLLENMGNYLAQDDDEVREELRLRRLQTESIFARLDDTLRAFYPPGLSPEDLAGAALDAADEAADREAPAVFITFNEGQRLALATALRLPALLAALGETPFARALAGVPRLRPKATGRLATRLAEADLTAQVGLTWSELLRLYQAAQVCALSSVADVMANGSLEDAMVASAAAHEKAPDEAAAAARHARALMLAVMEGLVNTVEASYPDEDEVGEAKAEISRLAELLLA